VDWENERYVRVYTRDTPEWLGLGWEARALFGELMRKVDRSGFLKLGRRGVAALGKFLDMPQDVVERALSILVDDGCVAVTEERIHLPNFQAAQEARKSVAERKREQRAREAKAKADVKAEAESAPAEADARFALPEFAEPHPDDPTEDQAEQHEEPSEPAMSRDVTRVTFGHAESQNVTLAQPSQPSSYPPATVPSKSLDPDPASGHHGGASDGPNDNAAHVILDALREGALVGCARLRFAEQLANRTRAWGGKLGVDDVVHAIRRCAEMEAATEAAGQFSTEPARLPGRIVQFVANTRPGEAADAARNLLSPLEQAKEAPWVLETWCEAYGKSRRGYGAYTPDAEDSARAVELGVHAADLATAEAMTRGGSADVDALARELVRHWAIGYLREDGVRSYYSEQRHPLRYLMRGVPTYGVPWKTMVLSKSVSRPKGLPEEQGVPPPREALEAMAKLLGGGPRGGPPRRIGVDPEAQREDEELTGLMRQAQAKRGLR
jgi:hypothetical protein